MLRISNSELKLTSQGYHFDDHGKKFVRILTSLNFVKIQIKIQPHKEMHIKSISPNFPYKITDNWVEIIFTYEEAFAENLMAYGGVIVETASVLGIQYALNEACKSLSCIWIDKYIDRRCKEIWFV